MQRSLAEEQQARSGTVGPLHWLNLHVCRDEIRCHAVITLLSVHTQAGPPPVSLTASSELQTA